MRISKSPAISANVPVILYYYPPQAEGCIRLQKLFNNTSLGTKHLLKLPIRYLACTHTGRQALHRLKLGRIGKSAEEDENIKVLYTEEGIG